MSMPSDLGALVRPGTLVVLSELFVGVCHTILAALALSLAHFLFERLKAAYGAKQSKSIGQRPLRTRN